jgi:fluoride exporter
MTRLFCVFVGGGLGAGTRYVIALWAGRSLGSAFPYGTLFANLAGCFLIAAVMHVSLTTTLVPPTLRIAVTTGFMGGLTTYSSFNYETTQLLQTRAIGEGALNFVVTAAGCFVAGLLGTLVTKQIFGG